MRSQRLELEAARKVLGIAVPGRLVMAAETALEEGVDSRSLRFLAGLSEAELDEALPTFEHALVELGIETPSKSAAVQQLAREAAWKIVAGSIPYHEGAKRIWELSLLLDGESLPELDSFVYAASEWNERPDDRPQFEAGILAAARELIEA